MNARLQAHEAIESNTRPLLLLPRMAAFLNGHSRETRSQNGFQSIMIYPCRKQKVSLSIFGWEVFAIRSTYGNDSTR